MGSVEPFTIVDGPEAWTAEAPQHHFYAHRHYSPASNHKPFVLSCQDTLTQYMLASVLLPDAAVFCLQDG
jgi:hypothetical protein